MSLIQEFVAKCCRQKQGKTAKAPSGPGIQFTNSFNRFLNGFGGINHVINEAGDGVATDATDSYLCNFNTSTEESFIQTRLGAELFLH